MKSYLLRALVLLIALALAQPVDAEPLLIQWGGNTVSQSESFARRNYDGNGQQQSDYDEAITYGLNLDPSTRDNRLTIVPPGDTDTDDMLRGISFNSTTAMSPTSGYSGPNFYGGVMKGILNTNATSTPTAGGDANLNFDDVQVQNQGGDDIIDVRFQNNNTASDIHFALVFKTSEFGGDSKTFTIDTGTRFSFTTGANNSNQITEFGEQRWIVKDSDGKWYISAANAACDPNVRAGVDETGAGIKNNTTYTSSFDSGQLTYWREWTPADGNTPDNSINFEPSYDAPSGGKPISFNETAGQFTTHTFTDIQYVGIYIEDDQFTDNVLQFSIKNLSFVPEPSSVLMMGAAGFGIAALIWFKRRKLQPEPVAPATAA